MVSFVENLQLSIEKLQLIPAFPLFCSRRRAVCRKCTFHKSCDTNA